ncbi:hypothetical protein POTOM_036285 [Populus tomentosa]|uniref:PPM-type phosphatase domain-containing protein n=1 Tax=Populus tomentosa TaxID=118781 RepID=A0A8X7YZW0_POPTO|nr:hypothetical protein POTOM_036285 [Populus tomentosa]
MSVELWLSALFWQWGGRLHLQMPFGQGSSSNSGTKFQSFVGISKEGKDGLLWYRDIGRYGSGEFSMAVFKLIKYLKTKARLSLDLLELLSAFMMVMVDLKLHVLSVITCSGTFKFFGAVHVCGYLCLVNFMDTVCSDIQSDFAFCKRIVPYVGNLRLCGYAPISAETQGVVTSEIVQRAFCLTEEGFTNFVSELWSTRPQMATVGSCCLVGVICQQTLFVANLGDSRVVLGKKVGNTGGIAAIQLSTEHNANLEAIRHELEDLHPNDSQIAVLKRGVWRVKGIIQVSRSIGDVYMKHARFNREPIDAKFRLPEPMDMPILSANPTILSHPLHPNDSFLVFASDGLWEHLSNEKVVDIVHSNPRAMAIVDNKSRWRANSIFHKTCGLLGYGFVHGNGSAKRLVKAALQEAARKRETRYSDLQKIDKKVRRHFHDDITVIVLFLNHDLISKGAVQTPPVSIRSALEH